MTPHITAKSATLDITRIREDFPILKQKIHGHPLVYVDNSNTTQKPIAVIKAMNDYYCNDNANIHRSVYLLSERATALYESTRDKIQKLINAEHRHEIIFVKGTTEGINLVASCLSRIQIKAGDEIIISAMEHHANIVPWQFVCEQIGAKLKVIPVTDVGELDLDAYAKLLNARTRLVAITHVSNVLGTINPVKQIIAMAHAHDIPVLIDGAQGVPHMPVDVQDLDCDFYTFSGHKMYAPTGIGVLYGKTRWLEAMPPYQGGGNMIRQVTFEKTTYNDLPYKFEAGTANIAAVVGFGAALDYLATLGIDRIAAHEHDLQQLATQCFSEIPELRMIGTSQHKAAIHSFVLENIHPHDIGTALDSFGVAVRVGHHCGMPLMERFGLAATVRVSFGLYNTAEEIEIVAATLTKVIRLFQ